VSGSLDEIGQKLQNADIKLTSNGNAGAEIKNEISELPAKLLAQLKEVKCVKFN